jgi:AcrR family transcriptional regulator
MTARKNPFSPSSSAEPDRLDEIYRAAARIICDKGFGAATMNDIADAVGITKAGIYHHISGKRDLLFQIMSYGLDSLEDEVISPAQAIADPEQRLRMIVSGHVRLITTYSTSDGNSPVSIVVDEVGGLTLQQRREINRRKSDYVDLIRGTLEELRVMGKLTEIDVTVAAFSILGMIMWVARWYQQDGRLPGDEIADQIAALAMNALVRTGTRAPE